MTSAMARPSAAVPPALACVGTSAGAKLGMSMPRSTQAIVGNRTGQAAGIGRLLLLDLRRRQDRGGGNLLGVNRRANQHRAHACGHQQGLHRSLHCARFLSKRKDATCFHAS
jgi:hypothetical protein